MPWLDQLNLDRITPQTKLFSLVRSQPEWRTKRVVCTCPANHNPYQHLTTSRCPLASRDALHATSPVQSQLTGEGMEKEGLEKWRIMASCPPTMLTAYLGYETTLIRLIFFWKSTTRSRSSMVQAQHRDAASGSIYNHSTENVDMMAHASRSGPF